MKLNELSSKSKPSPRRKSRCLPPGSATPAPSWWDQQMIDMFGPYPGPWTENTIWRLCKEAVLDDYYRNQT